ncbi:MAG TPA: FAD-linked oxidase C-terminal domain-containing protein [Synergistales bacterium]|nr:FAD-linked oxidase C-terminal domain-containing protein [Synergistales bacterium]
MTHYSAVTEEVVEDLKSLVGPHNVVVEPEKLASYSRDEVALQFWDREYRAEVLVLPESTDHVSAVLAYADPRMIPVTPRGAGTGLSGGAVPAFGGIVMAFDRMNRILEVDLENLTLTAEPGVVTAEIQAAAARHGLEYAGDPCSGDASFIGGNVAENAGGNKVIKYGTTGANVLALEVVLPSGKVTWFGGKRRKDVTGLDLVHLMVGSEGILGVITKVVLKLVPRHEKVVDLLVPFPTVEEAITLVPRVMRELKITPSSLEFMDRNSLRIVSRYTGSTLPFQEAGAHLIIQIEGNDMDALSDQYEDIGDFCLENGALEVFVADNRNFRDLLWKTRKNIAEAIIVFYTKYAKEDLVVPTGNIPSLLKRVDEVCRKYRLEAVNFGHVGDGNIHVNLLAGEESENWQERIEGARRDLYRSTRELGGTLSGEHGVGLKRKDFLGMFLDEAQVELIRGIKRTFDPNLILNPGKIVDI